MNIYTKINALHSIKILSVLLLTFAAYGQNAPSISELKTNGANGFPQKNAKILMDDENIRVSILNDANYLAVQSIVWNDNNDQTGENSIGQTAGDYSSLLFTTKKGNKRNPETDRDYFVNPLPHKKGLFYTTYSGKVKFIKTLPNGRKVEYKAEATSPLKSDSNGKAKIEYINLKEGRKVRIDTMLIPLSEINRKSGDTIRVCYLISSPVPALKFNSCGFQSKKDYFNLDIPSKYYRTLVLENTSTSELENLIP